MLRLVLVQTVLLIFCGLTVFATYVLKYGWKLE